MNDMGNPADDTHPAISNILEKIETRDFTVGIMGLGYVGLPLALVAVEKGFKVLGFDTNPRQVEILNAGESAIKHIPDATVKHAVESGKFRATCDFSMLGTADAILIAVPTPLNKYREPDLGYVERSTKDIAAALRPGQLVVLESTTWPGTTAEVLKPALEKSGLVCGQDFYLAYSPEREDPGNAHFGTATIPKVIGADDARSRTIASALYRALIDTPVPVSTAATAEAVKLTENIFRSVNIALVNELKVIFERMGIDVWEVIEAAKTKPFGYMPFYPGPGLGGHCIPIDPFYLTWKAREYEVTTRFIELAGEINTAMPHYVVDQLAGALDRLKQRGLNGARVLIIGLAYKKNIDDTRESPSLKLIKLIEGRGGHVDYYDPFVSQIPPTREYASLTGRLSIDISAHNIAQFDAVLIATDHDGIDWKMLADNAAIIVDTRNVMARANISGPHIIKA